MVNALLEKVSLEKDLDTHLNGGAPISQSIPRAKSPGAEGVQVDEQKRWTVDGLIFEQKYDEAIEVATGISEKVVRDYELASIASSIADTGHIDDIKKATAIIALVDCAKDPDVNVHMDTSGVKVGFMIDHVIKAFSEEIDADRLEKDVFEDKKRQIMEMIRVASIQRLPKDEVDLFYDKVARIRFSENHETLDESAIVANVEKSLAANDVASAIRYIEKVPEVAQREQGFIYIVAVCLKSNNLDGAHLAIQKIGDCSTPENLQHLREAFDNAIRRLDAVTDEEKKKRGAELYTVINSALGFPDVDAYLERVKQIIGPDEHEQQQDQVGEAGEIINDLRDKMQVIIDATTDPIDKGLMKNCRLELLSARTKEEAKAIIEKSTQNGGCFSPAQIAEFLAMIDGQKIVPESDDLPEPEGEPEGEDVGQSGPSPEELARQQAEEKERVDRIKAELVSARVEYAEQYVKWRKSERERKKKITQIFNDLGVVKQVPLKDRPKEFQDAESIYTKAKKAVNKAEMDQVEQARRSVAESKKIPLEEVEIKITNALDIFETEYAELQNAIAEAKRQFDPEKAEKENDILRKAKNKLKPAAKKWQDVPSYVKVAVSSEGAGVVIGTGAGLVGGLAYGGYRAVRGMGGIIAGKGTAMGMDKLQERINKNRQEKIKTEYSKSVTADDFEAREEKMMRRKEEEENILKRQKLYKVGAVIGVGAGVALGDMAMRPKVAEAIGINRPALTQETVRPGNQVSGEANVITPVAEQVPPKVAVPEVEASDAPEEVPVVQASKLRPEIKLSESSDVPDDSPEVTEATVSDGDPLASPGVDTVAPDADGITHEALDQAPDVGGHVPESVEYHDGTSEMPHHGDLVGDGAETTPGDENDLSDMDKINDAEVVQVEEVRLTETNHIPKPVSETAVAGDDGLSEPTLGEAEPPSEQFTTKSVSVSPEPAPMPIAESEVPTDMVDVAPRTPDDYTSPLTSRPIETGSGTVYVTEGGTKGITMQYNGSTIANEASFESVKIPKLADEFMDGPANKGVREVFTKAYDELLKKTGPLGAHEFHSAFEGGRIDVIHGPVGGDPNTIKVLLNGKLISEGVLGKSKSFNVLDGMDSSWWQENTVYERALKHVRGLIDEVKKLPPPPVSSLK